MDSSTASKSNTFRKFILALVAIFVVALSITTVFTSNTFADDDTANEEEPAAEEESTPTNVVETTFFGTIEEDGKGCGVYTILNFVVDILSIGAGILGVVGITIVGIQYLTAAGNEQQIVKAKHRMMEILIGLVIYALLYAIAQWLLPGGKLNTTPCGAATSRHNSSLIVTDHFA